RTHSISYMGRPTAGWGSINCAGAGQPGRVWQARTAPGVAMLPGEAGINVRKTARYASKDCDPLQLLGGAPRLSLTFMSRTQFDEALIMDYWPVGSEMA